MPVRPPPCAGVLLAPPLHCGNASLFHAGREWEVGGCGCPACSVDEGGGGWGIVGPQHAPARPRWGNGRRGQGPSAGAERGRERRGQTHAHPGNLRDSAAARVPRVGRVLPWRTALHNKRAGAEGKGGAKNNNTRMGVSAARWLLMFARRRGAAANENLTAVAAVAVDGGGGRSCARIGGTPPADRRGGGVLSHGAPLQRACTSPATEGGGGRGAHEGGGGRCAHPPAPTGQPPLCPVEGGSGEKAQLLVESSRGTRRHGWCAHTVDVERWGHPHTHHPWSPLPFPPSAGSLRAGGVGKVCVPSATHEPGHDGSRRPPAPGVRAKGGGAPGPRWRLERGRSNFVPPVVERLCFRASDRGAVSDRAGGGGHRRLYPGGGGLARTPVAVSRVPRPSTSCPFPPPRLSRSAAVSVGGGGRKSRGGAHHRSPLTDDRRGTARRGERVSCRS